MTDNKKDTLIIGDVEFSCRLITGTGKFASKTLIAPMLKASGSQWLCGGLISQ